MRSVPAHTETNNLVKLDSTGGVGATRSKILERKFLTFGVLITPGNRWKVRLRKTQIQFSHFHQKCPKKISFCNFF